MKILAVVFAVAAIYASCFAGQTQTAAPGEYIIENDVAIPMRDGVVLRADVLRPKGRGPFPVLVYRTPYGKEDALKDYTTFRRAVERGYAVVVQDVRGRYASAGEFTAYKQESHDGYDTIEWAAAQPWSNGAVGTFGLSYPGAVQWLAAIENPPHLKAMVPAMTFSTPQNFFYAGGTWDMSWIDWIWNNIAPDIRVKKNLPGPRTVEEAGAAWKSMADAMYRELPLSSLRELQGVAPYYYEWLRHPVDDPWWDWCELRNKYGRVQAAVLNLSAWYDDNYGPEGATTNFAGLLKAREATDLARPHLLLGPWVHGVGSTSKTRSGEREFGAAAAIDYDEVVLRWLDHYVRGVENGVDGEKAVRYFVMGANAWREADSWPPAANPQSYYLLPVQPENGKAGTLSPSANDRPGYGAFTSDPRDPVLNRYPSGAHDYRDLVKRKDVLTFDSAALARDMEVTGPIRAEVFLSCDCRDLDLWVHLIDVAPDGTAFNLMSPGLNVLRASYRDMKGGRQLLQPGEVYRLRLDNLITSNVFQKGHRIRVQISASFFPNFSRNLQNGNLEATSGESLPATIRIYDGRGHASRIVLPVVNP